MVVTRVEIMMQNKSYRVHSLNSFIFTHMVLEIKNCNSKCTSGNFIYPMT